MHLLGRDRTTWGSVDVIVSAVDEESPIVVVVHR